MAALTNVPTNRSQPHFLLSFKDELSLFQEESRFFGKLLRKASLLGANRSSERLHTLIQRLSTFRQETLPGLQRALHSLEGENANNTTADRGKSQFDLFSEAVEEARRKLNNIKREAFKELSVDFIRTPIW